MKHDAHTAELPLDDPTRPRHIVSNPEQTRKRDSMSMSRGELVTLALGEELGRKVDYAIPQSFFDTLTEA